MRLKHDSVVELKLTSQKLNEEIYIIGNINENLFLEVTYEFLYILEFADGINTIKDIHEKVLNRYNIDVDILEALQYLFEENLIYSVDGIVLGKDNEVDFNKYLKRTSEIVYSKIGIIFFVLIILANIFIIYKYNIFPKTNNALFIENKPGLSFFIYFIVSWAITCFHEFGHYLSAVKLGIPVKIKLSLRIVFLVVESDINSIWAIPQNKRTICYMAGFLNECLLLFVVLIINLFVNNAIFSRLTNMILLIIFINFIWQFMIFLRTDFYFVLLNILRISSLHDSSIEIFKDLITKNNDYKKLNSNDKKTFYYLCFYILGFVFSLMYYFYNLMIYYTIISKSIIQVINHNSNYLDDLILLVILLVSFILWFVGLYGRLKDRKMNKERNI